MYDSIPVKENETHIIEIKDISIDGAGIGKVNNFTLFIYEAVPGDVAEVVITKVKKSYAYGKILKLLVSSPKRTVPKCKNSEQCGGCSLAHIKYEEQLKIRTKFVKDSLERIGNLKDMPVNDIIGMTSPYNYRNKAIYHLAMSDNKIVAGLYAPKSHILVSASMCNIFHHLNSIIVETIVKFLNEYNISIYDPKKHKGLVRNIMIRTGFRTNEIMVCIVINGQKLPNQKELVSRFKKMTNITSMILNINTKKTKKIFGDAYKVLCGESFISSYIGEIKFQISANSFFQVNPVQTEKLFNIIEQYAKSIGGSTLVDAYCGTGSITLYLAKYFELAIGIDINEDAIGDAIQNSEQNNISNVDFLLGNAGDIIEELGLSNIDLLLLDPPRSGCDTLLLQSVIKLNCSYVIYVSCNPATLARDLKILCDNNFEIKEVQPVDMFGHSMHVECVVLITRKDGWKA